jgi:hypothetical protein
MLVPCASRSQLAQSSNCVCQVFLGRMVANCVHGVRQWQARLVLSRECVPHCLTCVFVCQLLPEVRRCKAACKRLSVLRISASPQAPLVAYYGAALHTCGQGLLEAVGVA